MKRMVWMQHVEEDELLAEQDVLLRSESVLLEEEQQRERFQQILLFQEDQEQAEWIAQWEQRQKKHWKTYLEHCKHRVIVRLLGEPLNTFLPHVGTECGARRARHFGVSEAELEQRVQMLLEFNPRLGMRGCRMAIEYDVLLDMQLRALFGAVTERGGDRIDILIPFVTSAQETRTMKDRIARVAQGYPALQVKIGAELSTPRAACVAGEIAGYVDFVVFDTMELTQMLYGMDWQDTRRVINRYLELKLIEQSPFRQLDTVAVGSLLLMGLADIRKKHPDCEVGVSGQPVTNEKSCKYCEENDFDFIVLPAVLPNWLDDSEEASDEDAVGQ